MEKMIKPLLVLTATLCIIPAYGCSSDMNSVMTGGACSIKELNKQNLESKTGSQVSNPKIERNLRPVEIKKATPTKNDCLFGMCLLNTILNDEQTGK